MGLRSLDQISVLWPSWVTLGKVILIPSHLSPASASRHLTPPSLWFALGWTSWSMRSASRSPTGRLLASELVLGLSSEPPALTRHLLDGLHRSQPRTWSLPVGWPHFARASVVCPSVLQGDSGSSPAHPGLVKPGLYRCGRPGSL